VKFAINIGVKMGIARALVNKLKRRRRSLNPNRGFRRQDKIDRKDEVLADSPGAYKYMRGIQRRHNESFGKEQIANPKKARQEVLASADVELLDTPDRIEATFASAALVEAIGVQAGDVVTMLDGALKGRQLAVTAVAADVVTLEADADLTAPETGAQLKIEISGQKLSYS
jgi:hypothetical protein